jgi:hypothetical protein
MGGRVARDGKVWVVVNLDESAVKSWRNPEDLLRQFQSTLALRHGSGCGPVS